MLSPEQLNRYSQLILDYSLEVKAGESVLVQSSQLATPLLLALQRAMLQRDVLPVLRTNIHGQAENFVRYASDSLMERESKLGLLNYQHVNCRIVIEAPGNTRALSNVAPERSQRMSHINVPMQEHSQKHHRWMVCRYPTDALAQDANMSLEDYTNFLADAVGLNHAEPVQFWKERGLKQAALAERLARSQHIHLKAPGTDLELLVSGRTWQNGRGLHNLPCGEVFTGPIENSANGHVRFHLPSSVAGREVRGAFLRFKDGVVVEATADTGEAFLNKMLDSDAGARRLGEIGIGTNYNIQQGSMSILFDEKIGGTVHLALGRSYENTGGVNQSAIHWDLICDLRQGGELYADGELIQKNGHFVGFDLH